MAIALPALWLVAVSVAFFLAAKLILTPAIVGILQRIPAIGRFLTGAARSIVNAVESTISDWVRPQLVTLLRWIVAASTATLALPSALEYLAGKIRESFAYMLGTTIPKMIHAITNPIVKAVNATIHRVTALRTDLTNFEHWTQRSISEGLRDLHAELLAIFVRGIDRLRHDVFGEAIPGVEAEVGRIAQGIEGEIGALGGDVADVARKVIDLAKRLDIPLTTIESLIAAVGVTAAIEALETLGRCSGKLRNLCTVDPEDWAQLMLGLATLLAFPGLNEMMRLGVTVVEESKDAIRELATS